MADFGVEYVGDTPGDIEQRLSKASMMGRTKADEALIQVAEEVKAELEASSPVDTGEYQASWYIYPYVSEEEVWILNEADHAQYVMLPNSRMIGVATADLPASGVLHNVKGRAKRHTDSFKNSLVDSLGDMIGELSIE